MNDEKKLSLYIVQLIDDDSLQECCFIFRIPAKLVTLSRELYTGATFASHTNSIDHGICQLCLTRKLRGTFVYVVSLTLFHRGLVTLARTP